jgi:transposase InsO family protein
MCRVYGVTRAGFYAWRARRRSLRVRQNENLTARIEAIHQASRGTYGSPRVHRALECSGCRVSENRVARLMRRRGIRGRVATIRYTSPNMRRYYACLSNEQLKVQVRRPDQVWVGDITYLKVGAIYRYLAVVMDRYSRRVLGWSFGKRKDVRLTLRALDRAVRNRRPRHGLIFHTDRGIEYAAGVFKQRLAELGIVQSMNRPGKVTDNAYIESFFHSMKSEAIHGLRFTEDHQIASALRSYVPFYNRTRLHSSLGYVSPATFEKQPA